MKIPLTQGQVAIIDDADSELVGQFKWCADRFCNTWYAFRRYVPGQPKYMHHLITGLSRVDHINGNGLDNRRENLRGASRTQNGRNMRKSRGSSRYKGVMWEAKRGLWRASISINGQRMQLGRFIDEHAAAHAYDDAARTWFGDFAALNFPRDGERSAHRGTPA